ncbi:hypothetical protein P43SY_002334 [Pythium insidiosum]|uniref:Uncharacterized protein n=1 Tax=Pythium insidiosum TaxID=114742 RepID=A0AAD5QCU2_PYTIN|nr:hypothetical protein P43SY_002334 [Pythium insidiosum]KAJ0412163.1 hypothetical protein ATCC90586_005776 [Pythium insidiosum]
MTGTSGGSNILRGGKRTYDCKTLVGNFVEESYRPNAIQSSWPGGPAFETTAGHQMHQGAKVSVKEFGAGLKKADDPKYDYHNIVGADKTSTSATWKSLTHSAHANTSTPTEFAAPREMRGRKMSGEELEAHRKRWTTEGDELRKMRYVTELSAATDKVVKPHFRKELVKPTQVTYH